MKLNYVLEAKRSIFSDLSGVLTILATSVCVYILTYIYSIYIYIYIYIHTHTHTHTYTWSELLVPSLVNMIKGCGNKSALLILLIFYKKKNHKNLTFNKCKMGGVYQYEIHIFFSNTHWT